MKCQNAGQGVPGCLEEADPDLDMDFSEVVEPGEPPVLHWCGPCHRVAVRLTRRLHEMCEACPEFAEVLEHEISKAEAEEARELGTQAGHYLNQLTRRVIN